jgi:hypothetical protein
MTKYGLIYVVYYRPSKINLEKYYFKIWASWKNVQKNAVVYWYMYYSGAEKLI